MEEGTPLKPDSKNPLDQDQGSSPASNHGSVVSDDKEETTSSSIEALNWSDFEDDFEESTKLHSSSHGIIDHNATATVTDEATIRSYTSSFSEDGGESNATSVISQNVESMDNEKGNETVSGPDGVEGVTIKRRRLSKGVSSKRSGDLMSMSTLSVGTNCSGYGESVSPAGSNAPVLDDGPIWAKGMKKYKFEENRKINQKLTFGVLFTVVLAIGLGLGNLVAYNECEAEHKPPVTPAPTQDKACPTCTLKTSEDSYQSEVTAKVKPTEPLRPTTATDSASASFPLENRITSTNQIPIISTTKPEMDVEIPKVEPKIPTIIPEVIKSDPASPLPTPTNQQQSPLKTLESSPNTKPMVDPKYALHAEELSRVLKMLDELSRKIDKFENVTRQLGGIVMLKDEIIPKRKKTDFLQILQDVVENRSKKREKPKRASSGNGETPNWKEKKQQVLDEIAGAVLEAMKLNEEDEDELESSIEDEPSLESGEVIFLDGDVTSHPPTSSFNEVKSKSVAQADTNGHVKGELYDNLVSSETSKVESVNTKYSYKSSSQEKSSNIEGEFDYKRPKQVKHGFVNTTEKKFKKKNKVNKKIKDNKDRRSSSEYDEYNSLTSSGSESEEVRDDEKENKKKKFKKQKDDKKRKYSNEKEKLPSGSEWQFARSSVREEARHEKDKQWDKPMNWQVQRDRVREKFRSKFEF